MFKRFEKLELKADMKITNIELSIWQSHQKKRPMEQFLDILSWTQQHVGWIKESEIDIIMMIFRCKLLTTIQLRNFCQLSILLSEQLKQIGSPRSPNIKYLFSFSDDTRVHFKFQEWNQLWKNLALSVNSLNSIHFWILSTEFNFVVCTWGQILSESWLSPRINWLFGKCIWTSN